MSEAPWEKFKWMVEFLVHRDGEQTLIPSRELTLDGLFMSVGGDISLNVRFGGGISTYYEVYVSIIGAAGDLVLKYTTRNGGSPEITFNGERVAHYTAMLQKHMPLEVLSRL